MLAYNYFNPVILPCPLACPAPAAPIASFYLTSNSEKYDEFGLRRLASAVVRQAIRDVRKPKNSTMQGEATDWLLEDAPFWMDGIGMYINRPWWKSWVESGCPIQEGENKITSDFVE